jgi:low temperature requirement protein LtrA
MRPRSAHEAHRAATPLELLFDLVFVIAVSQAAAELHHAIAEGHAGDGAFRFLTVFFAIWWAWMNFTWFASSYDTDDVPYRLAVLVQLAGALILAAGVPFAFEQGNYTIVTIGYTVMRMVLVGQWLRAARGDPLRRTTAQRFAAGVTLAQLGWIARLALPPALAQPAFGLLVALELAVPLWAERARPTSWHAGHIAERYGLFTIIVLGESILSGSHAIQATLGGDGLSGELVEVIVGGLLIVFALWWLYFDRPMDDLLTSTREGFIWGYGHLLIFASAAAVGAGLAVAVDHATQHAEIGAILAGMALAVPVAIFLLALLVLHFSRRRGTLAHRLATLLATLLVLLTPFTGHAVLLTGLVLAVLLAVKLRLGRRKPERAPAALQV